MNKPVKHLMKNVFLLVRKHRPRNTRKKVHVEGKTFRYSLPLQAKRKLTRVLG